MSRELRTLSSWERAPVFLSAQPLFARLGYAVNRIFGCWHLKLSRPITRGRESYQVCLRCGMRRTFDLKNWKHTGKFYPPSVERRTDK